MIKGFTLIELLVTLALISLFATLALPLAELTVKRSQEVELRAALRQIREALDRHKQMADDGRITLRPGDSGYPPTLNTLVEGVVDIKSPERQKIVFLRRIPRDPFNLLPDQPAAQSWGKRSYGSPPDAPLEGPDIFDVYSLSTDVGLNGIPYKEW